MHSYIKLKKSIKTLTYAKYGKANLFVTFDPVMWKPGNSLWCQDRSKVFNEPWPTMEVPDDRRGFLKKHEQVLNTKKMKMLQRTFSPDHVMNEDVIQRYGGILVDGKHCRRYLILQYANDQAKWWKKLMRFDVSSCLMSVQFDFNLYMHLYLTVNKWLSF